MPIPVVPRKGDVDRNVNEDPNPEATYVVPRKGDVDRNTEAAGKLIVYNVVPRKGDVDRNIPRRMRPRVWPRRPPQGGRG